MTHAGTLLDLDKVIEQAKVEACQFAVGEVQPRVVPDEQGELLHRVPVEGANGDEPASLSYLLIDVGWPRAFVRFTVQSNGDGVPTLSPPVLWPYEAVRPILPSGHPSNYVPLFEEWRMLLHEDRVLS